MFNLFRLTFPKRHHLRTKKEFSSVINEARSKRKTQSFIFFEKPNQLSYSRIGIIVSKKVSKKAVIRNLIKRKIRESYRVNKKNLIPTDIVIIVRSSFDIDQFDMEIEKLWKQISL